MAIELDIPWKEMCRGTSGTMMKMNLQGQPKGRIPDSELHPFPVGGNHNSADSNFHFHVQKFKTPLKRSQIGVHFSVKSNPAIFNPRYS